MDDVGMKIGERMTQSFRMRGAVFPPENVVDAMPRQIASAVRADREEVKKKLSETASRFAGSGTFEKGVAEGVRLAIEILSQNTGGGSERFEEFSARQKPYLSAYPEITAFAAKMRAKLREWDGGNDGVRTWRDASPAQLVLCAIAATQQLDSAVQAGVSAATIGSLAVDAALVNLMLCDVCGGLDGTPPRPDLGENFKRMKERLRERAERGKSQ